MRTRSKRSGSVAPIPGKLATRFIDEVLTATRGANAGSDPKTFSRVYEALQEYFTTLRWHLGPSDYDAGELVVPETLRYVVDGIDLYTYFRCWLRKQGIHPDTGRLRR